MAKLQPITGSVLAWAIDAAGIDPDHLEDSLRFQSGSVSSWIEESSQPNQGQLRKVAKELGRLPSFFFLPEAPGDSSQKVDFRKFAGRSSPPSRETIQSIELAQKIQRTMEWLRQESLEVDPEIPRLSISAGVEASSVVLLDWLGWSTTWQTSGSTTAAEVTKRFRASLEARGISVMHLSMGEGVTRGFSLSSQTAPLLAINTADPYPARLFSYAHELVHLALHSSAVCNVHEDEEKTEHFCNRVAAAILMPAQEFREHARRKFLGGRLESVEQVSAVRNKFKVSLRAAAIRAEDLGIGRAGLFDLVDREAEVKQRGGRYTPGNERTKPVIRVDEYGTGFIRAVQEGVNGGRMRSLQAATLLRLSEHEWNQAIAISGAEPVR